MMYVAERGGQIFRYSRATDEQMSQNYAYASLELGLSNQRPERSMVGQSNANQDDSGIEHMLRRHD